MTSKGKPIRLWQEIVLALALKILVLTIIWYAWFSAPEDKKLDDQKVANQIFSQQRQQEQP